MFNQLKRLRPDHPVPMRLRRGPFRIANRGQAVVGNWRGFRDIPGLRTIRSPVAARIYRLHRCLKKRRLLALDDLAAVLPPISTKGAS